MNFNGASSHAHAVGFEETFTDDVDTVFFGYGSDLFLSNGNCPQKPYPIEQLRHLYPPGKMEQYDDVDGYIDYVQSIASDLPAYAVNLPKLEDVLEEKITSDDGQIVHHGVEHSDMESLTRYGRLYPNGNNSSKIYFESLNQYLPVQIPYLDNRIIDISVKMPYKYMSRNDIVASSLTRTAPSLARIPRGRSNAPIHYPYYVRHWASRASFLLMNSITRLGDALPIDISPYEDEGPYQNTEKMMRRNPEYVRKTLADNEEFIRESNYLSWAGAQQCLDAHIQGDSNEMVLYILLDLLGASANIQ